MTLFLWTAGIINYSNIKEHHTWLHFFLLCNSFLRANFNLLNITNFQELPLLRSYWKLSARSRPHSSWCPSTYPLLVPDTFQKWIYANIFSSFCKENKLGPLSIVCGGRRTDTFSDLDSPRDDLVDQSRGTGPGYRWCLVALNPCPASSKSSSVRYLWCALISGIWC